MSTTVLAPAADLRSSRVDRTLLGLLLFAAAKLVFHTIVNRGYGFHRDELQTLDDARHLAWGFVAYPPLTPFLGHLELALFGTSLTGFRLLAAVAQSLACVVAARIARRLGGGPAAQWLTAIAVAIGPVSLTASSLFQYVSFDFLWWVLLAYFLVRRIDEDEPRWWLAMGAVIGLGALTKYTMAFLVAGLAVGVLLTPLRRDLRGRWPWLGAVVALLIASPNLLWLARHGWITLEFLQHIHARDIRIGRTDHFLSEQLWIPASIVTVPLWALGLWALLRGEAMRSYRVLAALALVPFALFVLAHGRGYYAAPLYPALLAAGAVTLCAWAAALSPVARRAVTAVVVLLLLAGASLVLIVTPIAPLGSPLFRFAQARNYDLREEVGWRELAVEVARIYHALPPAERAHTAIFAENYGEAGALALYGPALGLPTPICPTNSFYTRGYGNPPPSTVIVLGEEREAPEHACREVTLVGHTPNPLHVTNEETGDHPDIFLCRGIYRTWDDIWTSSHNYG
jgi:4-amino-4-deoxy-L-arabinose transferase-like glycosyltransferase